MTVSHLGQNVVEQKQNMWSQYPKSVTAIPIPSWEFRYILRKALGYQNVQNKDLSGTQLNLKDEKTAEFWATSEELTQNIEI